MYSTDLTQGWIIALVKRVVFGSPSISMMTAFSGLKVGSATTAARSEVSCESIAAGMKGGNCPRLTGCDDEAFRPARVSMTVLRMLFLNVGLGLSDDGTPMRFV